MNKTKERWAQKTKFEKLLFVTGMVCSVSVITLALLQLLGVWEDAIQVYMPLVALLMLVQALENWKRSRTVAIVSLCASIFVGTVCILILFVL